MATARFREMISQELFKEMRFFRIVPDFICQFGIPSDPEVAKEWKKKLLQDDPVTVSNTRGLLTFATAGANTRTTQMFFNYVDSNKFLDNQGFSPFAIVSGCGKGKTQTGGECDEGMAVLQNLYDGYGERPSQSRYQEEGLWMAPATGGASGRRVDRQTDGPTHSFDREGGRFVTTTRWLSAGGHRQRWRGPCLRATQWMAGLAYINMNFPELSYIESVKEVGPVPPVGKKADSLSDVLMMTIGAVAVCLLLAVGGFIGVKMCAKKKGGGGSGAPSSSSHAGLVDDDDAPPPSLEDTA